MSWRRSSKESENNSTSKPSCLLDLIASTWVDFFHAAFVSRKSLEQENERLRMSAVRRDLDTCYAMLQQREGDLQGKVAQLGRQAVSYKKGKNLAAARKKMLERARAQSQLDKMQNSILMIDMHRSTIEGTAIDISVLEALKASGETLRQMGATGQGLRAVEDLVSSIEESMQSAAEITTVLSSGSVSGVVNSMAAYGVSVDEDELMRELDSMTAEDEGPDRPAQEPEPAAAAASPTPEPAAPAQEPAQLLRPEPAGRRPEQSKAPKAAPTKPRPKGREKEEPAPQMLAF